MCKIVASGLVQKKNKSMTMNVTNIEDDNLFIGIEYCKKVKKGIMIFSYIIGCMVID